MKKIIVMIFVLMVSITFTFPINAFSNRENDVLIDNLNATIVYGDAISSKLYYFDIQFTKPNNTSKYVIFSTITRDDVYISKKSTELVFELMEDKDSLTRLDKDTYIYHDGSAPQWNSSSTTVSGFTLYISSTSGGNAQLIAQDLIDYYLYLYVDLVNVVESNVVNAFIDRYKDTTYISGYTDGYNTARDELFEPYFNQGYELGYNDGDFIGFETGYSEGYSQGLSESGFDWIEIMFTWFTVPFALFSIELLPNLYVGYFALFFFILGVLGFILKFAGKK